MNRYEFDFGVYECHPHYIIAEPKEGAFIDKREVRQIIDMVNQNYDSPFGFISNRALPSSGNLAIYEIVKKMVPLLRALAIVSYRPITDIMAETERELLKGVPFMVFKEIDAAKSWVLDQLGVEGRNAEWFPNI